MNRYCIDRYVTFWDEDNEGNLREYTMGDIISEYFDDESEFLYRLHQLEEMDDVKIDGAYRVELAPYNIY